MRIGRIFQKICKICTYIPVLWRDEDWDYGFILDILKHKLIRIKKCLLKNNIITESGLKEICKNIDEVLENIHNYDNSYEEYEKKYGKFPINTEYKFIKCEDGDGSYMKLYNADTGEELTEEEEFEHVKYVKSIYNFEQESWKNIWKIISDKAQGWWD